MGWLLPTCLALYIYIRVKGWISQGLGRGDIVRLGRPLVQLRNFREVGTMGPFLFLDSPCRSLMYLFPLSYRPGLPSVSVYFCFSNPFRGEIPLRVIQEIFLFPTYSLYQNSDFCCLTFKKMFRHSGVGNTKDECPLGLRAPVEIVGNLVVHNNTPPTGTAKARTNEWWFAKGLIY